VDFDVARFYLERECGFQFDCQLPFDNASTSSTHNTRIERVWVEVGVQFARRWKAFFERLEEHYFLRPDKPEHLWLLNTLFLEEINQDVQMFVHHFNNHGVKNSDMGSKTPKVCVCLAILLHTEPQYQAMRIEGMLQHGVYLDSWSDAGESELAANLGATAPGFGNTTAAPNRDEASDVSTSGSHKSSTNEASHSTESSFVNDPHVRTRVQREIKHHPVRIRRIAPPFDQDQQNILFGRIADRLAQHCIPQSFGLHQTEPNYLPYNPIQTIRVGPNRRNRLNQINLPQDIWLPRIEQWVTSLWELVSMQEELGLTNS
jgi:hypothetical protein